MDVADFCYLAERTTYRPSYSVKWMWGDVDTPRRKHYSITVGVVANVLDSRGSGDMIEIGTTRSLPVAQIEAMRPSEAITWLYKLVTALDQHESDEWFCVDGVRVRDPHDD